jgi:curved DNA-binding protein CbpA
MADPPLPAAQGDLSRTPFAHALLYCYQRGLSGTLAIWPEDPERTPGQDRILFVSGVPVSARFLVRASALDRGLLPLFSRKAGAYAFYADVDLVGRGELVRSDRVDPLALVAASLRGPSRDDVVERVLAGFGRAPVRFKPGVVDPKRFALLPKEQVFLDVVRAGPATIEELVSQCELGPQTGKRLLYLLAITKALEPWIEPQGVAAAPSDLGAPAGRPVLERPSGPPAAAGQASEPASPPARRTLEPEPPPPPPPGLSPEHLALWEEIVARVREIDHQNYFDMLGVERSASVDAVRKTFLGLAKKWHPDRLPRELAALKPWVERIFDYLRAAHDTLADEAKRGPYLRKVLDGGGTPEAERKLAAIVQAAMNQQKAEVLIKRRDYEGAAALLRDALELAPDDAQIHASYAWALYHLPSTPEREREMMASIDRALSLHGENDRAHYYRGMMLRRAGREAEAIAEFERAVAINPKNLDAAREVRLAQMRARSGGAPPPGAKPGSGDATQRGGGLLSRLFGSPEKGAGKPHDQGTPRGR